ncbi:MAG TPA: GNAT family protein, partial [Gaiella sp.]|nr:GNAT family protein [Gaiella sp.]
VAPAARCRGIAVRAIGLLTDWCLGALGVARVELRIDVVNEPSLRVAERLGFVRDGVLRSMHFKDGRRTDLAVYSRLPGD